MKTAIKSVAKAAVSSPEAEKPSREELLAEVSGFAMQTVEIIGGKKFPLGETFECIKVGVSKWNRPYTVLLVDGEDQFCDPKNLKVLKPIASAKVALLQAELDEARDATLILSGSVKNETENAVLIQHHQWFKPRWFPKKLISVLGDHEDGEQTLFEVPLWKVKADHGPQGVEALRELQDGFEAMLQPKAVTGKTSLIKKR